MGLYTKDEIFSETEWLELINELSLSPRQAEVIQCLFQGLSDKQIAEELQISVATLRTYLSRLFLKFDVQDRVELVLYVFNDFRNSCRKGM
ncbi:MAG: response regulator transcription factor [Planctomycetota bacterium]